MIGIDKKQYWDNVYQEKQTHEVSWYQKTPSTSLDIINKLDLPKTAKIIDIGGGESYLVDHLLEQGFTDITVLDISETAILRTQKRLGAKAQNVKWIIADIAEFEPTEKYDLWHDRATFHFLLEEDEINHYLNSIRKGLTEDGNLVIGTFTEEGPRMCSGVIVKQYTEESLTNLVHDSFQKLECKIVNHKTPFYTIQNFVFCSFRMKAS
ncbi:class I SAM-dependent methyltransferase [Sediminitomix flava]|uniref:Methyltransferase family protein n=1 Tax=Sediminitomix flava TaxID=379075 RepID=A0A315ZDH4_SEDFL|nr:class I SAM-dependent methyltransferase [Sediminitomix flava]PWJ42774.1 methyltransferase family protein [Sediminitomix flava]